MVPGTAATPDPGQLALFSEASHPVVEELKSLDVERLTPLEALNRLAEWKRRAERGG
jgi:DNA mismatch repair protein MutS